MHGGWSYWRVGGVCSQLAIDGHGNPGKAEDQSFCLLASQCLQC